MKENTKYHDYLFKGKIVIDEIQPWFEFGTGRPWDDTEIPWVLDNKVRRQILINLSSGPKSLNEIYENTSFSPKPLLISPEQYSPNVKYQWNIDTIHNHLMNLEWYNLIKHKDNKYELTFPIFNQKDVIKMEKYVIKFADYWIKIISDIKEEFQQAYPHSDVRTKLLEILIDKAVNKLYDLLKKEALLPDKPNLKSLWSEQIRTEKFEEWLKKLY